MKFWAIGEAKVSCPCSSPQVLALSTCQVNGAFTCRVLALSTRRLLALSTRQVIALSTRQVIALSTISRDGTRDRKPLKVEFEKYLGNI